MAIQIASDADLAREAEERRRRLAAQQIQNPQHQALPQKEKSAGSQMVDIASNKAMNKASDTFIDPMIEKGMSKAGQLASFVSPQAMTGAQLGALQGASAGNAMSASGMLGGGMSPGMSQAILGSSKAAAPLVAQTAGMTGGQLAAATAPGLTGAATAGAAGAAGGMAPMLAALGPIGLGIGGLMLAKKLKLFSEGGKVGPLHASDGATVEGNNTASQVIKELNKQLKNKEKPKDTNFFPSFNFFNKPQTKAQGGPVYASAGFRRQTAGSGGFLPVTSGAGYTPVTSGTSTTVAPLSYTAPAPIVKAAAPLASAGLPTQASAYYDIPAGQSFAQSQEDGLVENPYAWSFQNVDNTGDYYVMASAQDSMMVPTGGQPGVNSNVAFDNYWRAMDRAAGGDGGAGTTGLNSAGVPDN